MPKGIPDVILSSSEKDVITEELGVTVQDISSSTHPVPDTKA